MRYYKIISTGEEQTIHLLSPGDFAASFCSYVTNTTSEDILHTIADANLLCFNKGNLEKLYATDIKWQIFGRKLMEQLLLEKERRIIDLISLTAQDR